MAGTFDISTINVISPNGLVTKPLTVDDYGYAKIGDERVGVTPTNWIINGMFDVWQKGISATSSTYNADDRWFNGHNITTKTVSRQAFAIGQTDVPNNPTYFSRTVVASGNTNASLIEKYQNIEDVTKLAGKIVTLSFWAKADGNKNMSTEFAQVFGTGGSAGIIAIGVQKYALTTVWKRFTKTVLLPSINGKTIGDGSYTRLSMWFDAGSDFNARTDSLGNQSGTFDIANVCLVEGSVPVECPNEPYAEVLRKCQRYYQRWGGDGTLDYMAHGFIANSTTSARFFFPHNVTMRIAPTSIEYNQLQIWDGGATFAVTNAVIDVASKRLTEVNVTSSGLTAYRPCGLLANGTTTAYLGLSAEL